MARASCRLGSNASPTLTVALNALRGEFVDEAVANHRDAIKQGAIGFAEGVRSGERTIHIVHDVEKALEDRSSLSLDFPLAVTLEPLLGALDFVDHVGWSRCALGRGISQELIVAAACF